MKNPFICLLISLCVISCKSGKATHKENNFAIAVHGGAGTILRKNMTPELEAEYRSVLELAIKKGYKILENGGTSMEAVKETIVVLEDSPLFNAGKGAVFTNDERNELDAAVMDGKTLSAGAVAGVTKVKNPILLATAVMEKSPHVLLSREGAEKFAQENGLEMVEPSYFHTAKSYNALQRAQKAEAEKKKSEKDLKFGTVGCVALDKHGNLAAGTSTGGMTNKKWGRIGDSPIIGAGTYANNATCAVSATGWGEFFIRSVVAYDIAALMEYKNFSLKRAEDTVISKVAKLGGDGGVIGIDKNGTISFSFNTAGMYRASINKKGELYIGIYEQE
jgi:L-asparaginase / beta-aspartyl-peptidase